MREALAIGVLALLFLGTLLRLVPSLLPLVTRLDVLGLLPEWRFFAPRPGRGDHHLLYRDSLDGASWGPWTELPFADGRRWHHAVWYPGRRSKKAFLDHLSMLQTHVVATGGEAVEITVPYLALLGHVTSAPRGGAPPALTQFLILYHDGAASEDDFVPTFRSHVHRYDGP